MIVFAAALAPVGDLFAKMLAVGNGVLFICFGRYLFGGALALAALWPSGQFRAPGRRAMISHAGRAALMAASVCALVAALSLAPMADALAGFYLAPIMATAMAATFLGERMTPMRLFGAGVSAIGAFAILGPTGEISLGGAIAIGSGALFALYLLGARAAPRGEHAPSAAAVQSLIAAALLAPLALMGPVDAPSWREIALFIGIGAISVICQGATLTAHRWADASTLAPFFYAALISSLFIGYFGLGETPSPTSLFGVLAIAAGGAFAAWEVRRRPRLSEALA